MKNSLLSITMLFALLGLLGCGQSNTATNQLTDEQLIQKAIEEEYGALFTTELVTKEQDNATSATAAMALAPGYPLICDGDDPVPCWFRIAHVASKSFDIHIQDGQATVSLTKFLEGSFMIDTDGDYYFGTKRIEDMAHRSAVFVRDDTKRWHWELQSITPVLIQPQDNATWTITIKRVTAKVDNTTRWEVTSPEQQLAFPDGLAHFRPGEVVVVEAEIETTDQRPCQVFLHYTTKVQLPGGQKIRWHKRVPMYDDGTNGDKSPGDGVFTGTYTIGQRYGFNHAGIDVINNATFEDETTDNYNSTAIIVPYLVE